METYYVALRVKNAPYYGTVIGGVSLVNPADDGKLRWVSAQLDPNAADVTREVVEQRVDERIWATDDKGNVIKDSHGAPQPNPTAGRVIALRKHVVISPSPWKALKNDSRVEGPISEKEFLQRCGKSATPAARVTGRINRVA